MALTAAQPKLASSLPEENEPIAIEPNTRKSLNDWTLLRSSGPVALGHHAWWRR